MNTKKIAEVLHEALDSGKLRNVEYFDGYWVCYAHGCKKMCVNCFDWYWSSWAGVSTMWPEFIKSCSKNSTKEYVQMSLFS